MEEINTKETNTKEINTQQLDLSQYSIKDVQRENFRQELTRIFEEQFLESLDVNVLCDQIGEDFNNLVYSFRNSSSRDNLDYFRPGFPCATEFNHHLSYLRTDCWLFKKLVTFNEKFSQLHSVYVKMIDLMTVHLMMILSQKYSVTVCFVRIMSSDPGSNSDYCLVSYAREKKYDMARVNKRHLENVCGSWVNFSKQNMSPVHACPQTLSSDPVHSIEVK